MITPRHPVALRLAASSMSVVGRLLKTSALAALLLAVPRSLRAQQVTLSLGERTQDTVRTGQVLRIPVLMQGQLTRSASLAAIQGSVRWDPARFGLDSLRPMRRPGITLTTNQETGTSGLLRFSAFSPEPFADAGALFELFFVVKAPRGKSPMTLELEAAGDELGRNILARTKGRGVTHCIERCVAP